MTALLTLKGVSVNYGRVAAVRDVDLEVEPGQLVSIVGPNGAGKSTLMKTIAGLQRPASGSIEFDGRAYSGTRPERIARLGLSLVPEGRHVFDSLTVSENLYLGRLPLSRRDRRQADVNGAIGYFPALDSLRERRASTLSGGEQQMLAIARALVARPRLLVLDEPTLGLAPQIVDSVFTTIERLHREGVTIILVEQNSKRALGLADTAVALHKGTVRATAGREQLVDERYRARFAEVIASTPQTEEPRE